MLCVWSEKVTAGLAESNGSLPPGESTAGWLSVHRDQLWAQRSVTSMGSLYLCRKLNTFQESYERWEFSAHFAVFWTKVAMWRFCYKAESRLAQHRAARAEAREIRSRELERQRREVGHISSRCSCCWFTWFLLNVLSRCGLICWSRTTPNHLIFHIFYRFSYLCSGRDRDFKCGRWVDLSKS